MTGDVFRGYLLDGFFNLVGALTGQGILLVGMMTEAVVTPLLSDRDLALQNVRYVLDAAGGLGEDFHPPRDGFIASPARAGARRGRRAAGARSSTTPARRDRRRHVRADEAARRRAARAWTASSRRAAATSTRRSTCSRPDDPMSAASIRRRQHRPALRRHHRRRHGAGVVHAAAAARQAGRGRRPPAGRARWAWTRRCVVHAKAMGPDFTFFVVYGPVQPPRRRLRGPGGRARVPAAVGQGGQRGDQVPAAPQAGRRRCLHRHRRAHGRHRRDPQRQGLRGGEGPGVLPGVQGGEPRRPGLGAGPGRAGERGDARTPSWSRRS